MTFYLPFDENVYRNQMKANFDLVFGNSIKTNKQSIYLMLPLFLFGLFTWIDHIKGGRFTCTIGTEKTDNLALFYVKRYVIDNSSLLVFFD